MRNIPSHRTSRARGFTLVELLVVIAIIGVLVGLLLPAVQAARESGRRVSCANNLKQLSLGCLLHESSHKHLPTGGWAWYWSGDPDRGFGQRQPGGWSYAVLPFIEQTDLRNSGFGKTSAAKRPDLARTGSSVVSAFYCPTRRFAALYPNPYNTVNSDAIPKAARTDYAANCGTNQNIWWNAPNSGDPSFADAPGFQYPTIDSDGVIFTLSALTTAHVSDGLSSTYLLGEKYLNPDNAKNGLEGTDNNPLFGGFDWDWQRWSGNGLIRDRRGLSDWLSFGSSHPSGANMAMCDGSVRTVSFGIDKKAHAAMCARDDGETVSGDY